jgi:exodeoxyribonuclease VII small subunit
MKKEDMDKMTYEEKEKRLDEILKKLDSSETPMDKLASEAKEAAALIMAMNAILVSTKQELTTVFEELDRQRNEAQ